MCIPPLEMQGEEEPNLLVRVRISGAAHISCDPRACIFLHTRAHFSASFQGTLLMPHRTGPLDLCGNVVFSISSNLSHKKCSSFSLFCSFFPCGISRVAKIRWLYRKMVGRRKDPCLPVKCPLLSGKKYRKRLFLSEIFFSFSKLSLVSLFLFI